MLSTLLMVMLTQLPLCTPGETSLVCACKAGTLDSCLLLVGSQSEKAEALLEQVEASLETLNALEMAGKASDKDRDKKKELQKIAQALGGSEPPNCNGQEHHPISRRVARQMEKNPNLKGLFKPRDPRYVTRARDEQAHCGYQDWHRKVDEELIEWLKRKQDATPEDFLEHLREIYSRPGDEGEISQWVLTHRSPRASSS